MYLTGYHYYRRIRKCISWHYFQTVLINTHILNHWRMRNKMAVNHYYNDFFHQLLNRTIAFHDSLLLYYKKNLDLMRQLLDYWESQNYISIALFATLHGYDWRTLHQLR